MKYEAMEGNEIKLVPLDSSKGGKIWVIQTTEENCNIYKRNNKLFVVPEKDGGNENTQMYKYNNSRLTSVEESFQDPDTTVKKEVESGEKKNGIYSIEIDGGNQQTGGSVAELKSIHSSTVSVLTQKKTFLFCSSRKNACQILRVCLWLMAILAVFSTVIYFFGMDHDLAKLPEDGDDIPPTEPE